MQQVILDIKNDDKARFLLDFLKQLDFIEIRKIFEEKRNIKTREKRKTKNKQSLDDLLLKAPTLSAEEIQNIEEIGKGFENLEVIEL